MSTSMLAANMQKAANDHKLPVQVRAFPFEIMEEIYEKERPDCILLGPQVRFLLEEIQKKYEPLGAVTATIDPADYGAVNGANVLRTAILLIKQKKA